jgi:hypothetical protein
LIHQRLSKIPVSRQFDEEDVRGPDGRVIDLDDGVGSDDEEQEDYGSDVYSDEDEAVHSDAGELDYEENSEGEVFVSEDEQADDDDNDEANGDDVPNWDELVKSVKNHDNAADGNGGGDDDDDGDDDDGDAPPRKRRRRRTSTKEDGDPTDGALPVMPERVSMLHCSDPLASIVRALTHTHTCCREAKTLEGHHLASKQEGQQEYQAWRFRGCSTRRPQGMHAALSNTTDRPRRSV